MWWVEKNGHRCLDKHEDGRCEYGTDTKRAIHERVSRRSGKDDNGRWIIGAGDIMMYDAFSGHQS